MKKSKRKTFHYIRYLRKSNDEPESVSIHNQDDVTRVMVEELIRNDPDNDYIDEGVYSDENYSGTDSERPDFKIVLKRIALGEINMVAVTDLSRLSRNTSESINYIQGLFVSLDVRFISYQLPHIDTFLEPERIYGIEIPMQSIMNENHCAETSAKVRRSLDRMKKDGKFIGAFCGYGWKKDPNDKHKLLLDEEPVRVLHQMRDWLFEGKTTVQIANMLNERGVLNRSGYKKSKGFNYKQSEPNGTYLWSATTVRHVMLRPENAGDLIQNRSKVKSYKVHKKVAIPEDDWIIIKNAIPAIYTREELKRIKEIINSRSHVRTVRNEPYLLTGFLECADCGHSLTRHRNVNNYGKEYIYYNCSHYKHYGKLSLCTPHTVKEEVIVSVILKIIQKQIDLAIELDKMMEKVNKSDITNKQSLSCESSLELRNKELNKVKNMKRFLYEDWKNGDISREEYKEMKEEYVNKEENLIKIIKSLEIEKERLKSKNYNCSHFLEEFKKYQNITKLTREVLSHLIDKILVHEDGSLTVKFRFADEFKQIQEYIDENKNTIIIKQDKNVYVNV